MQTMMMRRTRVIARCECNPDQVKEKFQVARRKLMADRKRYEERRVEIFKTFHTALKRMAEEELEFVKQTCSKPEKENDAEIQAPTPPTESS